MGVDIFFHAEVRKKDKWQPLIWYRKPQENLESWRNEKIEDNGMVARYYLYGGRAYHYDDVLEDLNASHGFPEDMSDELRARLSSDKYITNGYFSLKDLTHYIESQEKKMLANLLQSRDYQLVQHMQRIEKAVLKQPMDDQLPETYLADYSIEQIYEDYLDEMYRLIRLSEVVYYLAEQFHLSTYEADIRIIYQMY